MSSIPGSGKRGVDWFGLPWWVSIAVAFAVGLTGGLGTTLRLHTDPSGAFMIFLLAFAGVAGLLNYLAMRQERHRP